MCKLIVAINNSLEQGSNEPDFKNAIALQYDILKKEPHGIAGLVITKDNQLHLFREYKDYDKILIEVDKLIKDAKFLILHTRTSTGGAQTLDNVHLFEDGDYLFAHNGWVPKYAPPIMGYHQSGFKYAQEDMTSYSDDTPSHNIDNYKGFADIKGGYPMYEKENVASDVVLTGYQPTKKKEKHKNKNKMCDSFQFLQALPKPITVEAIEKEVKHSRFYGTGIIINKKTHEAFLIVKKDTKMITDQRNWSVVYSFEPETEVTYESYKNIFGVDILSNEETIKVVAEQKEVVEGVYQLQIKE